MGVQALCVGRVSRQEEAEDGACVTGALERHGQEIAVFLGQFGRDRLLFFFLTALGLHCSACLVGSLWTKLPCSVWDPRSPTRDHTCDPCIGRQILNH